MLSMMSDRQLVKRKVNLQESYDKMCVDLEIEERPTNTEVALTMGQMLLEISEVEIQLQARIISKLKIAEFRKFKQLVFSFLNECEINDNEIPF